MAYVKRKCDYCGNEYKADTRNLKRGWGLCCSKSCAANKREQSKPNYDPKRVERNNTRRKLWAENGKEIWARQQGYPNFEAYERDCDGGSFGVELEICDLCGLRSDFCTCGEGAYLD